LFVGVVTVISIIASESTLLLLYMILGDAAFGKAQVFYTALIVPVIVSLPVCYVGAGMALQLTNAHAKLKQLAHTDELTGLINRRSFFEKAEVVLHNAQEAQTPLSLLVIDADYFKQLNDTFGHATGDAALKFIAERLESCVRKTDLVGRLGGEEFAILLSDMSEKEADILAGRILKKISSHPMVWDNKIIEMSVSCGIADSAVSYDMTELFKAADDALYGAKRSGRNRQVLHTHLLADTLPARATNLN
jgi:diguanylate cyclase (GGDEF)-like protein